MCQVETKIKNENDTLSAFVKKKPISSEIGKLRRTSEKLFFGRDILEKVLRNRTTLNKNK